MTLRNKIFLAAAGLLVATSLAAPARAETPAPASTPQINNTPTLDKNELTSEEKTYLDAAYEKLKAADATMTPAKAAEKWKAGTFTSPFKQDFYSSLYDGFNGTEGPTLNTFINQDVDSWLAATEQAAEAEAEAANGTETGTGTAAQGSLLSGQREMSYYAKDALDTSNFLQNGKYTWVTDVWQAVRQMSNILIVVFLFFGALATTLNYNLNTYGIKRVLPSVVQAAILANFSYIIINVAIEAVGLAQKGLMGLGVGSAQVDASIWDTLAGPLKTILEGFRPTETTSVGQLFWGLIAVLGVAVAMLLLWLSVGIMYLRSFILSLLIVFAPLAILSMALPATQGAWKKWWEEFLKWLLVPLLICFWLMVAGLIASIGALPAFLKMLVAMFAVWQGVRVPFTFKPLVAGALIGFAAGKVGNLALGSAKYAGTWAAIGSPVTRNTIGAIYRGFGRWQDRVGKGRTANVTQWTKGQVFQGNERGAARRKARLDREARFQSWYKAQDPDKKKYATREIARDAWLREEGNKLVTEKERASKNEMIDYLTRDMTDRKEEEMGSLAELSVLELTSRYQRKRDQEIRDKYGFEPGLRGGLQHFMFNLTGGETGRSPIGSFRSWVNALVASRERNQENVSKEYELESKRAAADASEQFGCVMERQAQLAIAEETIGKSLDGMQNYWKTVAATSKEGTSRILQQEKQFAEERAKLMESGLKMAQAQMAQALHRDNSPEQQAFNQMMAQDPAVRQQLAALGIVPTDSNYLEAATKLSSRSAAVASIAEGAVKFRELRLAHRESSRHKDIYEYATNTTKKVEINKAMQENPELREEYATHLADALGRDRDPLIKDNKEFEDAANEYAATGIYARDEAAKTASLQRVKEARAFNKTVNTAQAENADTTFKYVPIDGVERAAYSKLDYIAESIGFDPLTDEDNEALLYGSMAAVAGGDQIVYATKVKKEKEGDKEKDVITEKRKLTGDMNRDALRAGREQFMALLKMSRSGLSGKPDWQAVSSFSQALEKVCSRLGEGHPKKALWVGVRQQLDAAYEKAVSVGREKIDKLTQAESVAREALSSLPQDAPTTERAAKESQHRLAQSALQEAKQSVSEAEGMLSKALADPVFRPFLRND